MKPSDFVSTSGQKQDMSQSVLQTEMTDAVNSGIVGRADKSEKSLKSGLYSVGKRASTGGAASAALAAVTNGRKGGKTGSADGGASPKGKAGKASAAMAHAAVHSALEGSELEGMDDLYNSSKGAYRAGRAIGRRIKGNASSLDIKGAVRNAGKGAVISGVRGTFQESELEGVDNVYDGARAGYHVVRGVKKRLSGKNPISSDKSLGKLSEKKSAIKAADTVEAKRKVQAAGYFKKSVYKASADVQAAGNIATSGKVLGAATAAGGKSGLLIALGAASPVIIMAVIIILLLFAALTGLTGEKANEKSVGSLQGVPAEVALYLKGYGYTNEAIAGILGNMAVENSAFDPGLGGDDGYGTDSIGLIQLSGANKNDFLRWCANTGKVWSTVSAQMEWTFSGEPGTGYFASDWYTGLASSYYRLERGYEERFGKDFYRSGEEIKASTDVDLVTYSFMACHERCGSAVSYGDDVSRLYRRLEDARKFLAQLNAGTGGGQDYASAEPWQQNIYNQALSTPSPGAGWCAKWVSTVYYNAGLPYPGGDADDMYRNWCHSSDRSQLKVGMMIAVDQYITTGHAYAGYTPDGRPLSYHVGIYMGNGMVRDNIGAITDTPLDEWIATYGNYHEVRWGFPPGVPAQ